MAVDLNNWNEARKAVEQLGTVNLLVNNAGISLLSHCLETTEEEIDR